MITLIDLPTISILFIWIISGKSIPMAYHIQGLSKIFIAIICFALIKPQIQEIFHQKERHICSLVIKRSYQDAI